MGRRPWREPGHLWWIGFGALLLLSLVLTSWRIAFITLLLWSLYEFSLVPTICRVMTREGFACREAVRGRLYACGDAHQRVKNDALWGAVGLRNPFRKAAVPDPNRDTGVVVYSPALRARLAENDRNLLGLAALGALAAIVGGVLGL